MLPVRVNLVNLDQTSVQYSTGHLVGPTNIFPLPRERRSLLPQINFTRPADKFWCISSTFPQSELSHILSPGKTRAGEIHETATNILRRSQSRPLRSFLPFAHTPKQIDHNKFIFVRTRRRYKSLSVIRITAIRRPICPAGLIVGERGSFGAAIIPPPADCRRI